ncbi:g6987 [Coccomyxa viridis]|uniref:G6987 protein n=1 Tax=Coccomyxa viridis TaxID=1274662 RepID=A0ABP1FWN9_9CHLO
MAAGSTVSFIGRLLFALLFLSSGAQKLQSFNVTTGGPVMSLMAPKMDTFLGHIKDFVKVDIPLEKEHYVLLLGGAIFLELAGAVLFLANYSAGAYMLLLFTVSVTPVIHNWWDIKDQNAQLVELIMFFKNIALIGALLFYLGGQARRLRVN